MLDVARPLVLVGGGKMGEALLAGWLGQGVPREAVLVVEPAQARRELLNAAYDVRTLAGPDQLPASLAPGVLLLAVKPQVMEAILPPYAGRVAAETLVLSIAAGKPIALIERELGSDRAIVRAMPNTPAAVGRGATVLCANAVAGPAQRSVAERLSGRGGPSPLGRGRGAHARRDGCLRAARPMSSM